MKHVSQSAKKLGLYIHALSFVIGMPLLVVINLWIGSPYWVLWVLPAWSIGLLSHWLCTPRSAFPNGETN